VSNPPIYDTEGIVLHTSPLGEADRLLTVMTSSLGKLHVTARGVRKPTSKLGGHLDPLTRSSMTLVRGRNLDTITSADSRETFGAIKSNLYRLSQAIYLAELVDLINPLEAPSLASYTLFLNGLRILSTNDDLDLVVRYTELQILNVAGFLPELWHCVECYSDLAPGQHLFSPAAGGIVCPLCRTTSEDSIRISLNALKLLRFLSTTNLSTAISLRVKVELHREVSDLMVGFLRRILDRDLRSNAFLRLVNRPSSNLANPARFG
jgi:DNA repair protein RecO (recombination protein O)